MRNSKKKFRDILTDRLEPQVTLDLNKPTDAREYIFRWIERGELQYEDPDDFWAGDDDDFLHVAHQLFMDVDPRPVLGVSH
jgi:hypothetical protein